MTSQSCAGSGAKGLPFIEELASDACATPLPDYSPWAAWCRDIRARYPIFTAPPAGAGIHPEGACDR